jgi:ribosomal protein S18 acetylase RimI-like enzyme
VPAHRRATVDDHAAVAALLAEADDLHARLLPRYFRRSSRPARSRADLSHILSALDEVIDVIDGEGGLAGLVHAQIFDTPPQPSLVPRRRCHIDSLVVTARARRGGAGRRLVEAAAAWGRAKGAEELLLTVWAGNDAADRFYERLGFTRVSSVLAKPL